MSKFFKFHELFSFSLDICNVLRWKRKKQFFPFAKATTLCSLTTGLLKETNKKTH